MLHYLWSMNLSKIIFQLTVSITFLSQQLIIFSLYFSIDLKVRGYPIFLISWFINIKDTHREKAP